MPGAPKRILVIDDQADEREIQMAMLSHLGYDVVAAEDGATGLEMALESPPDLVLLDIAMPKLDGFEVCRRLRADPRTANVAIVFFTASVIGDIDQRAKAAGATGLMMKPLDPHEVARCVQQTVGPPLA